MRLALWQTVGVPLDSVAHLAGLERTAQAAATAGAALLLCPECWLCGYNIGSAVASLAEPRDGPSARRIGDIARRHGIAIAYGYAERDGEHVFNAVQVLDANGLALAHYRKTHLFGAAERAAYVAGDRFAPPFLLDGWRMGLLICYDVEFPECARALALAGAELLLVPTAQAEEYAAVVSLVVPARAIENQMHVAYCNRGGIENGLRFLGGSLIVAPDGRTLAAAGPGEALLITDLERGTRQAGAALYPYLADRRPEMYGSLNDPGSCAPTPPRA